MQKKVKFAILQGIMGAFTDIGAQLVAFGSADIPRAVVVGLVLGGGARVIGAWLAAEAIDETE